MKLFSYLSQGVFLHYKKRQAKISNIFRKKKGFKDLFGHVERRLDKKAKIHFEIYDVTEWETNYYNTNIAQYRNKEGQP